MHENAAVQFRPELQVKVEEAYAADNSFIADAIFPIFPVSTRTGYYKRIKRGKGQLLTNPGNAGAADPLKRAPGTAYREITRTTEQDSWKTVDRGLKELLDDVNKQDESRFYDQESSTAVWLSRNMRIARESRVASVVFSEAVWGDAIQSAVAFDEVNLETIDFPALLKEAIRKIRKRQEGANSLVISEELYDIVTASKKLREYFFGANGGNASIDGDMIAKKFRLGQVLIGSSSYDTTKPGKDSSDDNLVWTWGNKYFWVGNVVGGAPEMGGAGRTMVLDELTGGELFVTESWYDQDKRSTIIRVRQDDDTKIVNENSGVLVQVNELA